jgi:hypothetical protein
MPTFASSPIQSQAGAGAEPGPGAVGRARRAGATPRRGPSRSRRRSASGPRPSDKSSVPSGRLGHYRDACGRRRELVALDGRAGSLLVVDRDAVTLADRRLVAHLASDEPPENARLVCRGYLERPHGRWCRRMRAGDLLAIPPCETPSPGSARRLAGGCARQHTPIAAREYLHLLAPVERERSIPELRWCRRRLGARSGRWEPVGLREVIAALEDYEPVRALTAVAIARHRDDSRLALRRLCGEYRWLCTSPVVLNRALREAVLRAIDRDELSMSEIALRCGVLKRDRHGDSRGETSWLARRVGLMPEGGAKQATPWIHSDVLALIAREGLRLSPHEVEVP